MWSYFVKFAQSFAQILVIIWPDQAQLWPDGTVYNFSHFRKLWVLESNTFNQELSSSEAKLVHCSLAVVGLSADKINILQHVKCPFSAVALAVKMLDEMNMVCHITEEPVIYCCLIFIF